MVESGPLRLTRAGGAIEGELRVADVQGRLSWMPIDLSSGRFPFDVVRSIAVVGNTLYVGTDAGLQAYDGTDVALERARLIALRRRRLPLRPRSIASANPAAPQGPPLPADRAAA